MTSVTGHGDSGGGGETEGKPEGRGSPGEQIRPGQSVLFFPLSFTSYLNRNVPQMSHQLDRIHELLQSQNAAIVSLNDRISKMASDFDSLHSPNYDKIFSYIDKQVRVLMTFSA